MAWAGGGAVIVDSAGWCWVTWIYNKLIAEEPVADVLEPVVKHIHGKPKYIEATIGSLEWLKSWLKTNWVIYKVWVQPSWWSSSQGPQGEHDFIKTTTRYIDIGCWSFTSIYMPHILVLYHPPLLGLKLLYTYVVSRHQPLVPLPWPSCVWRPHRRCWRTCGWRMPWAGPMPCHSNELGG